MSTLPPRNADLERALTIYSLLRHEHDFTPEQIFGAARHLTRHPGIEAVREGIIATFTTSDLDGPEMLVALKQATDFIEKNIARKAL